MTFTVTLTRGARDDLLRMEEFLVELALARGDVDLPGRAITAIHDEMRVLRTNPYTCRKVGSHSRERELVIPFGNSGYIALFEIISDAEVAVTALRHQREDDYH